MTLPAHYTTPSIPRRLAGRKAALRLVAKGHLSPRSLTYQPASRSVDSVPAQGAMRGAPATEGGGAPTNFPRTQHGTDGPVDSSGPGRAVHNPFMASDGEAAHDVSVGPPSCSPHGSSSGRLPPAPDVVRDPAS